MVAQQIYKILEGVKDPEIPAVSIVDLGIVRDVRVTEDGVEVVITPTYSGCPAMKEIEKNIMTELKQNGFGSVYLKTVLSPPWSSDWITPEGRRLLKESGIAPPGAAQEQLVPFPSSNQQVRCPYCDSEYTHVKSNFGATACKALYYCDNCQQPFEHFKSF
ncbi:MAG: phenylacetate-CoA oxygenase subunit PaaJ [Candidatus Dadabacteria bacterium]|nr:MAG: phenylacetate-CoA oxygenase subunit PaaJ [Candidatus Dadabacteria bacterium]